MSMDFIENFMVLPDFDYESDSYYEEQERIFHELEDREWEDVRDGRE